MKTRLKYIDIAKGIMIICLCFHHFPQAIKQLGINGGGDNYSFIWLTYKFYACYFMQAFFIITGLCSNFSKDFREFLFGNLKNLVIPAISFDMTFRIINYFICGQFLGIGFWFLYTLFFCKLLYWFVNKCKMKKSIKRLVVFLISLFMIRMAAFCKGHGWEDYNYLYYQNVLSMFLFLYIGVFLRNIVNKFDIILPVGAIVFILLLLYHLFGEFNMPFVGAGIASLDRCYIINYLLFSISGSFFILFVSNSIGKCKILEQIGRLSLLIYGFHFIVLKTVTYSICHLFSSTMACINLFFLVSCFLTTFITVCIATIISRTKYLSFYTGKW